MIFFFGLDWYLESRGLNSFEGNDAVVESEMNCLSFLNFSAQEDLSLFVTVDNRMFSFVIENRKSCCGFFQAELIVNALEDV